MRRVVKAVGVLAYIVGWGGGLLVFGWAILFWGMGDNETPFWRDPGFLIAVGSWLVTMVLLTVANQSINRVGDLNGSQPRRREGCESHQPSGRPVIRFLRSLGLFISIAGFVVMVYPILIGMGMPPPLVLVEPRYREVIRGLEKEKFPIGKSNIVALPPRYRSVAWKVYAERRPDGRLFVLFPTALFGHSGGLTAG